MPNVIPDAIECLSSETAGRIVNAIRSVGRTTLTQLAETIGRSKATVHHHLDKMTVAGILARDKVAGRQKVYYRLARGEGSTIVAERTFGTVTLRFGVEEES